MLDVFKVRVHGEESVSMVLIKSPSQTDVSFDISIKENFSHTIYTFKDVKEAEDYFTYKVSEYSNFYGNKFSGDYAFFRGRNLHPWGDSFLYNIEPKVKPLIKILIEKLYLTVTSCQSHSSGGEAYIDLAFTNNISKQKFMDEVKEKTKGWLFFQIREMPLDKYMDRNFGGYTTSKKITDPDYWCSEEDVVEMLNFMFNLNFSDWKIVRIAIKRVASNNLDLFFLTIFDNFFLKRRFKRMLRVLESTQDHQLFSL
jgi:hypothetical protein